MRRRKHIRLKDYDYSLMGSYFVTICIKDRKRFFGKINDGVMWTNVIGKIAEKCWIELAQHFSNIEIDEYIVMPNHVHGIIIINDDRRDLINQIPTDKSWILMKDTKITLGKIIRSYKARTCRMIRLTGIESFEWQHRYYDHVIRNEKSLNRIREYIRTNPEQWARDKENQLFQCNDKFDAWLKGEVKQKISPRKFI